MEHLNLVPFLSRLVAVRRRLRGGVARCSDGMVRHQPASNKRVAVAERGNWVVTLLRHYLLIYLLSGCW